MSLTRRTLLRNAAFISAAAAASPLLAGCRKKATYTHGMIQPGSTGMNIFFEGAWLFASNGTGGIYAIARDMSSPCIASTIPALPHTFPFGRWTDESFDKTMPQLKENTQDSAGNHIPYTITLTGISGAVPSAGIFTDTINTRKGPFVYITNPNKDLKVDLTKCGLRVISIPTPYAIVPCGFVTNAAINDPNRLLMSSNPNWIDKGVATTHIFQYPARGTSAVAATFTTDTVSTTVTNDYDLHFHAVPPLVPIGTPNHAPSMFLNLISILYREAADGTKTYLGSNDLAYTGGGAEATPGTDATSLGIDPTELDILAAHPQNGDVASCASGGFGLG